MLVCEGGNWVKPVDVIVERSLGTSFDSVELGYQEYKISRRDFLPIFHIPNIITITTILF